MPQTSKTLQDVSRSPYHVFQCQNMRLKKINFFFIFYINLILQFNQRFKHTSHTRVYIGTMGGHQNVEGDRRTMKECIKDPTWKQEQHQENCFSCILVVHHIIHGIKLTSPSFLPSLVTPSFCCCFYHACHLQFISFHLHHNPKVFKTFFDSNQDVPPTSQGHFNLIFTWFMVKPKHVGVLYRTVGLTTFYN